MNTRKSAQAFGLIIIGNEVLDGRVRDSHFVRFQELLRERSLQLAYSMILPDDPDLIDSQLRWAMARREPFFCCGGIGSTPDDYTRGCAARVNGVALEFHPEGVAILEEKWGKDVSLARLKMVEFPRGSALIPNPYNRIPGFTMGPGHYLPGFPEMAGPMAAWVLDTLYERGAARAARALVLPGAREADLVDIMEAFVAAHPDVSFSSLPRFVPGGTEVRLGVSGAPDAVESALRTLTAALEAGGVRFVPAEGPIAP